MRALTLIIDGLAVYRIVRLVKEDSILNPLRARAMFTKAGDVREWVSELLSCAFCLGIWVAMFVTTARWTIPTAWTICAYGLAIACAAPLLARLEPDD